MANNFTEMLQKIAIEAQLPMINLLLTQNTTDSRQAAETLISALKRGVENNQRLVEYIDKRVNDIKIETNTRRPGGPTL